MFQSFKDFLTEITHAPQADSPAEGAQRVQLAAAVLMVEVVRADGRMDASERAAALAALRRRFDLAPEALDALLDQAQDSARSAYDYQQFTSRINDAFTIARDAAGLDPVLDLHCLRHSYVTHLVEFDYPERFVSTQVGHSYAATTAIYTGVSDEYRNRLLRRSLHRHPELWESP